MRFVEHERSRQGDTIENLWIPLPDGARLAARAWLPADAQRRPVPAVLEYIPYRKRDMTRRRDEGVHPYLASSGYACLRVDLRGSGDSDGVLRDQYLEQELADGVDAIRWIASQPWCNGRVGMLGISWGGFNALQLAARQPPELGAIVAVCATDDLYHDNMHYMGGCLLADNLSEATTMFAFNGCPPDPAIVGDRWRDMWMERLEQSGLWLDIWLRHQTRDAFWKRASVCEDYRAVRCPVMAVSGWADGYTNAVFRLLAHLDVPRQGLVGPWGHRYPHRGVPGPPIGFLQEVVRWFDRWLGDPPHEESPDPVLRVWMQDSVPPSTRYAERPGRWVAEPCWPSPHVETHRLRLCERGLAWSHASTARTVGDKHAGDVPLAIQSPLTVGLFAGKWCSYAATPDLPYDQRQEDGGALIFETDPLGRPLEILGQPVVELELSADRPFAQVVARLSDVRPDGKATRITFGLLNLTHHSSDETPCPLVPGRRYRVRVPLNYIAQRFPAEHRIRLSLSTSYWPLAWPPPAPTRLRIVPWSSELRLPVRPPRPSDARLRPFDPPEAAHQADHVQLAPEAHDWIVTHRLEDDSSVLEVINDFGSWWIQDTETVVRAGTWEWYRSRADDFQSIEGETRTERAFRRGDWNVEVRTRTRLRSSTTHFHLSAELDAYEDRRRVFSRNWSETIARNGL